MQTKKLTEMANASQRSGWPGLLERLNSTKSNKVDKSTAGSSWS